LRTHRLGNRMAGVALTLAGFDAAHEAPRPWTAGDAPRWDTRNTGEATAFLGGLPTGFAAAAFFDPQYRGVLDKLAYGNEGARQKERTRLAQMDDGTIRAILAELGRTLKESGHLFFWIDKFHLCEGLAHWFAGTGLQVVDLITWDKGRIGMGYRTRRKCEYLVVLQKPPIRAKAVWKRKNIPDVWTEKVSYRDHPHAKPTGLQAALVESVTRPGDLIIDPAAGSWSVMEACRAVGDRRFLGVDLKG
jgi:site-specific DNA-methyltransferase (adenine-specific)